ncbi:hypothetical protein ID866_1890 [Astraeus odoratus]|nr:hypothetical protein ID866_1890 [Astraeus odoratus]
MSAIETAVACLREAVANEGSKKQLRDVVDSVSSCLVVLNSSRPSLQAMEKLRSVLGEPMQQLYSVCHSAALQLSSAILSSIFEEKLSDAYILGDPSLRAEWDKVACMLLTRVLDILDETSGDDNDFKLAVGKCFYPVICRLFFGDQTQTSHHLSVQLCTCAYGVLGEAAHGVKSNQDFLRNKAVMGPVRLGIAISNSRGGLYPYLGERIVSLSIEYLVTESLLTLLARLLSTDDIEQSRATRAKFIQETLGSRRFFKCSKELIGIVKEAATSDWDVTAIQLVEALARGDITYPQPFAVDEIDACGHIFPQLNASDRLILDKRTILANVSLSREDAYDSLEISYGYIRTVTIDTTTTGNGVAVLIALSDPPTVGNVPLELASGELYLKFMLKRVDLGRFMETLRRRGIGKLNFVNTTTKTKKPRQSISLASEVMFIDNCSPLTPTASFEQKIKHVQDVYKTNVDDTRTSELVLPAEVEPVVLLKDDEKSAPTQSNTSKLVNTSATKESVGKTQSDDHRVSTFPEARMVALHNHDERSIPTRIADSGSPWKPLKWNRESDRRTPDSRHSLSGRATRYATIFDSEDGITTGPKSTEKNTAHIGRGNHNKEEHKFTIEAQLNGEMSTADALPNPSVHIKMLGTGESTLSSKENNTQIKHSLESNTSNCPLGQVPNDVARFTSRLEEQPTLGTEQAKVVPQLIGANSDDENSQIPNEGTHVATKLGKRHVQVTKKDAIDNITSDAEESGPRRKICKTSDDGSHSVQDTTAAHPKLTTSSKVSPSTRTRSRNGSSPATILDRIGEGSKEMRSTDHKSKGTQKKSASAKRGTRASAMQRKRSRTSKPKPRQKLVPRAITRYPAPVPPEETVSTVPVSRASSPVPRTIPNANDSVVPPDSPLAAVCPTDIGDVLKSKQTSENLEQIRSTKPLDSDCPFSTARALSDSITILQTLDEECRIRETDSNREVTQTQVSSECSTSLKDKDHGLMVQEKKEVATIDLTLDEVPDSAPMTHSHSTSETGCQSETACTSTSNLIEEMHELPAFSPSPPRKHLSVTFASPLERVMCSNVRPKLDKAKYGPLQKEINVKQKLAGHIPAKPRGSGLMVNMQPSTPDDDPLLPLPLPTGEYNRKMASPVYTSQCPTRREGVQGLSRVSVKPKEAVDVQDIADILNDIHAVFVFRL